MVKTIDVTLHLSYDAAEELMLAIFKQGEILKIEADECAERRPKTATRYMNTRDELICAHVAVSRAVAESIKKLTPEQETAYREAERMAGGTA
ncbi:MAG TPA: hypothetical protein O0X39_01170 [Methanocorpusculum sp.]|nr:hypothetical protein [Methanocorpusculum sp.]